MRRWSPVVGLVMMSLLVVAMPPAWASCPSPPKDCNSTLLDLVRTSTSETTLDVGAYQDDAEAVAALVASQTPRPKADDHYDTGEHGGIYIAFQSVGEAHEVTVEFASHAPGVAWDDGSSITITDPQPDTAYLIPFTVTSTGRDLALPFTIVDDLGGATHGALHPIVGPDDNPSDIGVEAAPDGEDSPAVSFVVLGLALVGLVALRRRD